MKILHTIEGVGAKFGGIATCTYDLIRALNSNGSYVDILSPSLRDRDDILLGIGEQWNKCYPNDGIGPINYSRNLNKWLKSTKYDLYHANGMWQYIVHATCEHARTEKKPYVITPHGMLYPEALARNAWKKWPMRKLWFDRDMREAACLHATCEEEMKHLRNLGYRGPIAVIGNPVAVPDFISGIFSARQKMTSPFWGVAFLGRLHPRKKVENLLSGVARASSRVIKVYIIGTGDNNYAQFLKTEADRLEISDRVEFLGFINGFDKFAQLGMVDALFVPSDMENFGMIIPEALIVGTPVMASLGTPWESLNTEKCGWWCDNSPESIAKVIDELYSMSDEERLQMGQRGHDFILRTFAEDNVANKMRSLYEWLLGEAEKPEFVIDRYE